MTHVLLLRHGVAEKNVTETHGGEGTHILTTEVPRIKAFAEVLISATVSFEKILYAPRLQCEETAKQLSEFTGISCLRAESILPINLGVVDGMTEEQVRRTYPAIDSQMRKWKAGEMEINELQIPGMENCFDFFAKGYSTLSRIIRRGENVLLVCTRSSLVLFGNIFMYRNPEKGGGYREIIWGNLDYITFKSDGDTHTILKQLSNLSIT